MKYYCVSITSCEGDNDLYFYGPETENFKDISNSFFTKAARALLKKEKEAYCYISTCDIIPEMIPLFKKAGYELIVTDNPVCYALDMFSRDDDFEDSEFYDEELYNEIKKYNYSDIDEV